MTRMLTMTAIFGLAVAASACIQGDRPASLAENQPSTMTDSTPPEAMLSGSSRPEPAQRPIDFQDSRTYGNNGGA
jgi:hypothetical protein